jgi:hypothetical protein
MLRVFIVIVLTLVLSACDRFFGEENECGGSGHQNVKIEYGDGIFRVDAVVKIKKKRELRFKLFPDNRSALGYDYKKTKVEIVGKIAKDKWLKGNAAYEDKRYILVCVSDEQALGDYNYTVKFTDPASEKGIGLVDPRIVVIRN